jgi:murein DD-endopeptidase MepM/ murein hydrolase activator NlpD
MLSLRIASTLVLAAVTAVPVATVREALLEKSPRRAVVFVSFDAEPEFAFSVRREQRTVVLDFGKAKLPRLEEKLGQAELVESARLVQVNPRDVRLTLTARPGAQVTLYRRDVPGSNAREFALLVERPAPDAPGGPVAWPVNGRLSSKFGWRVHPILGVGRMHHGVDLAVKKGTPIRPMQAGTVVFAGSRGEAGLCVIVDHGGGLRSSYGHCQKILVKPGDAVERTAIIAHSGDTGMCTGPHVHFAVTKDGKPVDPAAFLKNR